jgi:ADP-heptose:LPS heptosyltransferase
MTVARILRETDADVIMFGQPSVLEKERAKLIMDHVIQQNGSSKGLHSAISNDPDNPNWPVRRSLATMMQCSLMIGPDTGPMWALAFEQIPQIVLLGHASPENITKHWINTLTLFADQSRVPCWPCHRLNDSIDTCRPNSTNTGAACISDIPVETIIRGVHIALGG